jgi:hypothetical protein
MHPIGGAPSRICCRHAFYLRREEPFLTDLPEWLKRWRERVAGLLRLRQE